MPDATHIAHVEFHFTPGVNVDRIDVQAGMTAAAAIGFADPKSQMVVQYALQRWARGEEDGSLKSFHSGGVDLTSAYQILAAARASSEATHTLTAEPPAETTDEPVLRDQDGAPFPDEVQSAYRAAVADLTLEVEEYEDISHRMANLLTRTAVALKGEPAPLSSHDWSDLPEVAGQLREALRPPHIYSA